MDTRDSIVCEGSGVPDSALSCELPPDREDEFLLRGDYEDPNEVFGALAGQ